MQGQLSRTNPCRPIFMTVLFLLVMATAAQALEVPPLKGRVNDYGDMLATGTVRQLDGLLKDLEASDGTQIVLLTIPSLEGDSLEDFSIRLADQWKIGQAGLDNGAILLIARADRKVRIEVGYGLEGRLTDLMAGRIISNIIVPQFKAGRIDQGVIAGVQAMVAAVKGEYAAAEAPSRGRDGGGHGLFGLVLAVFILNVLGRLRRWLGMAAGAVIVPIIGTAIFGFSLTLLAVFILVGLVAGLLAGLLGSPLVFGHANHRGGRGGFWMGGGGGLGGGGFGGFSGGGGGFGGGGASGGW